MVIDKSFRNKDVVVFPGTGSTESSVVKVGCSPILEEWRFNHQQE